jgi:cell division transport system permease protein
VRAVQSSVRQLSVSTVSTMMTFMVIGIALALPMSLYVLLNNVRGMTNELRETTRITLYTERNIQRVRVDNLLRILRNDADIEKIQYVSPEEGLKSFQEQFQLNDVIDELKENPLPGVVVIQPAKRIQTVLQSDQLVDRLKRLPLVKDVQLDMAWLQRLNAMISFGYRIISLLIFFFAFTVLSVIGNTIRLMTQNNRDEIIIVKLMGGKNDFVRRPFLYSGMIYGLMGSIVAWFLVDSMIWCLQGPLGHLMKLYGNAFELKGLDLQSTLLLLMGGILLGYFGSWLAVGHHIKSVEPE